MRTVSAYLVSPSVSPIAFPIAFLIAFLTVAAPVAAQDLPTIESKTASLEKRDGLFPLYWDDDQGKVWLEVGQLDEDFLYAVSLPTGLGSNDIGLDRNQLGGQRVVRFERIGRKLLLVAPNLRYRAISDNVMEAASVREAFAEGTVWSFTIEARSGDRFLVDATSFIARDAHGVVERLRRRNQGTYKVDAGRSSADPAALKAFPDNTEMQGRLTFVSDRPGSWVRSVASVPEAVTLAVRHSFIRLPDDGYTPRVFDPRSGYGSLTYADYAAPIGQDMQKRFIRRHRLQKQSPGAAMSEAVEPIVYYLDPGTPEPVRSALLDGARWWNQAYEAAGFIDAFQVRVLPDGADPLDVRYNMINWVHRSTRGWSYGSSVTDPRTGEIIKGHVLLGSLRVRQDYLLMEGLMAPYQPGWTSGGDDPMLEVSLARIRQLSAHEVGHTIGLSHNYASSMNDRASVMDYPAPRVEIDADDNMVFDSAYDTGIGEWDKVAIRYGYAEFPDSLDEKSELDRILGEAHANGLMFITDSDSRPPGASHPSSSLWDNGVDATDALHHAIRVRQMALSRFGVASIKPGEPLATMHEAFVPLYLHHRYQVEAAAKLVGGMSYDYALRGDGRATPAPVLGGAQRGALLALLNTVTPEVLGVPSRLRSAIPPRPPGYGASRELFSSYAAPLFDPYAPAEVGAALVFGQLLVPERMARLQYQADLDPALPSLSDMLAETSDRVWADGVRRDSYDAELQRVVQMVWTDALIEAAASSRTAPGVRARLWQHLQSLADWLADNGEGSFETTAHRGYALDAIERYLSRDYDSADRVAEAVTPPGSPIGSGESSLHESLQRQANRRAWMSDWVQETLLCEHGSW